MLEAKTGRWELVAPTDLRFCVVPRALTCQTGGPTGVAWSPGVHIGASVLHQRRHSWFWRRLKYVRLYFLAVCAMSETRQNATQWCARDDSGTR